MLNSLLLNRLQTVYDDLCEKHSIELRAVGSRIPAGGDGWMDLFFKMEGIRGVMTALRAEKPLEESIKFGCDVSSIAVKLWNTRREWQVHRWEETAHHFIWYQVRLACNVNSDPTLLRQLLLDIWPAEVEVEEFAPAAPKPAAPKPAAPKLSSASQAVVEKLLALQHEIERLKKS